MRGKAAFRTRVLCFHLVLCTLFFCDSTAHERKLTELRRRLDAQTLKYLRGDTELLGWLDIENGDVEKVGVVPDFFLRAHFPFIKIPMDIFFWFLQAAKRCFNKAKWRAGIGKVTMQKAAKHMNEDSFTVLLEPLKDRSV